MSITIESILFKCYSKAKRKIEDNGKCDAVLRAYDCFIFARISTSDILLQKEKIGRLLSVVL